MKTLITFLLFSITILAQDSTKVTIESELKNIAISKENLTEEFKRMQHLENYLLFLKKEGYEITKTDTSKTKK